MVVAKAVMMLLFGIVVVIGAVGANVMPIGFVYSMFCWLAVIGVLGELLTLAIIIVEHGDD